MGTKRPGGDGHTGNAAPTTAIRLLSMISSLLLPAFGTPSS